MPVYQLFTPDKSPTWWRWILKHTMPSALKSIHHRPRYLGAHARRKFSRYHSVLGLYYRQVILQASYRYDLQPAPFQRRRQQSMPVHTIPGTSIATSKLIPSHPQCCLSDRHINSKKKIQLRVLRMPNTNTNRSLE